MIEFVAANWLWIAAIVFFAAMHRSGHGCGMHSGHGRQRSRDTDTEHAHHSGGGKSTA